MHVCPYCNVEIALINAFYTHVGAVHPDKKQPPYFDEIKTILSVYPGDGIKGAKHFLTDMTLKQLILDNLHKEELHPDGSPNKTRVAKEIGISRMTLYNILETDKPITKSIEKLVKIWAQVETL